MNIKHLTIVLLWVVCCLFLDACSSSDESYIPVTGIELNQQHLSMIIGESFQLEATLLPQGATEKYLNWKSSKSGIADVDETGLVTAHIVGSTLITVSTPDGKFSAKCSVSVSAKVIHVEDITLDVSQLRLKEGDVYQIRAFIAPADATNKNIIWKSSNEQYATVKDGFVTALSVGATTITATTEDGGKKASCSLTISSDPERYTIATNGQSSFKIAYANETQAVSAELVKAIKGTTGATLTSLPAKDSTTDREILVGKTDRKESTSILSKIGSNGYAIATLNGKIVITATGDMMLSHALWDFQHNFLENKEYNTSG
ncbi:MAG: Ig domain-containing protein [Alistipes sp.]|nr:Ig domain-containing protein [Candidatus Alistipes equi]